MKVFNVVKWIPFVLYAVAIVFNIISGDYDMAVMYLCLLLLYGLVLMQWSTLNAADNLKNAYKDAYEKECRLFEEALVQRKKVLDEIVSSKELAEDMLRIFNNVDKMYKLYDDRD